MVINDSGVRLRTAPGLSGEIIRILKKGESVTMITDVYSDNDAYRWINVKTVTGTGWVYGEFVSLEEGIVPYKLNSLESIRMPIGNGVLEIGMTKDAVLKILGKPMKTSVDTDRNEEWLDFNLKGNITIMITRYNNRVNQIVLSTAEHVLANGIHIGIDIKGEI